MVLSNHDQGDSFISDDEEELCPLCVEEMDISDKNFKPCPCGYQVCQFCYNNIRQNPELNGRCPACRRPYADDTVEYRMISQEEWKQDHQRQTRKEKERKQREREKKETEQTSKKHHLSGMRVIQKNLVYVIGLNPNIPTDELHHTLRGDQFFGQYGKIQKIVINRRNNANGNPGIGVYVTFARKEDALRCIQAVDGSINDGKYLRAAYGTTKYCSSYLRGQTCPNPNCMFLHEPGEEADSYTRQDLSTIHAKGNEKGSTKSSTSSPAPTSVAPRQAPVRKDTDDHDDGSALPAGVSWAQKSSPITANEKIKLRSTIPAQAVTPTSVPAISSSSASTPTTVAQVYYPDPQTIRTDVTAKCMNSLLEALGDGPLDYTFTSSLVPDEDISDPSTLPPYFSFNTNGNIATPNTVTKTDIASLFAPSQSGLGTNNGSNSFLGYIPNQPSLAPSANTNRPALPTQQVTTQQQGITKTATPPPGLFNGHHSAPSQDRQVLLAQLMGGPSREGKDTDVKSLASDQVDISGDELDFDSIEHDLESFMQSENLEQFDRVLLEKPKNEEKDGERGADLTGPPPLDPSAPFPPAMFMPHTTGTRGMLPAPPPPGLLPFMFPGVNQAGMPPPSASLGMGPMAPPGLAPIGKMHAFTGGPSAVEPQPKNTKDEEDLMSLLHNGPRVPSKKPAKALTVDELERSLEAKSMSITDLAAVKHELGKVAKVNEEMEAKGKAIANAQKDVSRKKKGRKDTEDIVEPVTPKKGKKDKKATTKAAFSPIEEKKSETSVTGKQDVRDRLSKAVAEGAMLPAKPTTKNAKNERPSSIGTDKSEVTEESNTSFGSVSTSATAMSAGKGSGSSPLKAAIVSPSPIRPQLSSTKSLPKHSVWGRESPQPVSPSTPSKRVKSTAHTKQEVEAIKPQAPPMPIIGSQNASARVPYVEESAESKEEKRARNYRKHVEIDLNTGLPIVHEIRPSVEGTGLVEAPDSKMKRRQQKKLAEQQLQAISKNARDDKTVIIAGASTRPTRVELSRAESESESEQEEEEQEAKEETQNHQVKETAEEIRDRKIREMQERKEKENALSKLRAAATLIPKGFSVPGTSPAKSTGSRTVSVTKPKKKEEKPKPKVVVPTLTKHSGHAKKEKKVHAPISKPSYASVPIKNPIVSSVSKDPPARSPPYSPTPKTTTPLEAPARSAEQSQHAIESSSAQSADSTVTTNPGTSTTPIGTEAPPGGEATGTSGAVRGTGTGASSDSVHPSVAKKQPVKQSTTAAATPRGSASTDQSKTSIELERVPREDSAVKKPFNLEQPQPVRGKRRDVAQLRPAREVLHEVLAELSEDNDYTWFTKPYSRDQFEQSHNLVSPSLFDACVRVLPNIVPHLPYTVKDDVTEFDYQLSACVRQDYDRLKAQGEHVLFTDAAAGDALGNTDVALDKHIAETAKLMQALGLD